MLLTSHAMLLRLASSTSLTTQYASSPVTPIGRCRCTLRHCSGGSASAPVFGCRLIAQQTAQTITPHCGQAGNSYPQCNCSRNSILMPPSAPSLQYIGRQPIMCPYYYYTEPAHQSALFLSLLSYNDILSTSSHQINLYSAHS